MPGLEAYVVPAARPPLAQATGTVDQTDARPATPGPSTANVSQIHGASFLVIGLILAAVLLMLFARRGSLRMRGPEVRISGAGKVEL